MSDARVLAALAGELDVDGVEGDPATLRAQLSEFAGWEGARVGSPDVRCRAGGARPRSAAGDLASAAGSRPCCKSGEPYLAATARAREVWLSASEASALGASEGQLITRHRAPAVASLRRSWSPRSPTAPSSSPGMPTASLARAASGCRLPWRDRDETRTERHRRARRDAVVALGGQGRLHLRIPRPQHADHDLGRATRRGPDAAAGRSEPGRARSACSRDWPTASSWR